MAEMKCLTLKRSVVVGGYEDVAMGIDALYAGLDIWIADDIKILHNSHNRTDGLFDHVKGRHLIMDRYRRLDKITKQKDRSYNTLMLTFGFYIIRNNHWTIHYVFITLDSHKYIE